MIRSRIPPPPAPDPCPDPVRRILMKALANDPAVRYQSAQEFANDLILFRTGGASTATMPLPSDETRRTQPAPAPVSPSAAYDVETRRTQPVPSASPAPAAKPPAPKKRRTVFSFFARVIAVLALLCVLLGFWSIMSYYSLRARAHELERRIKSEQLTDPDQILAQWNQLAKPDPTSWALSSAREAVDSKLVNAANLNISRFRDGTQAIYEKDWQRSQTLLSQALAINPDDETIRGELRLCEGHIARLEGGRHHDPAQLTVAAEKFNEARKLLPKSPDPYLGLALLYIYGLKDVDKADAALQQAARLGYALGNRERGELADGYRDRATRLFTDAINVRGLPQEKDQIARAVTDFNHALALYQSIPSSANTAVSIKRVNQNLDSANARLQEIQ
jgi:tetratricopeptide (TPR) repeat protein